MMIEAKDSGVDRRGPRGLAHAAIVLGTALSAGLAGAAHAGHLDFPATPPAFTSPLPATSAGSPTPDAEARARLASAYGRLPIRFEPNVGQAPSAVKYLAHAGGYSVGLTESGALLDLNVGRPQKTVDAKSDSKPKAVDHAQFRLSLDHASSNLELHAERKQDSVSNYFIGRDQSRWHRNVANYAAVRYTNVYRGIDWVVYGNPQQLEYDLVVAPHADPGQIRLNIEGADRLALDANGDLLVKVQNQTIRQLKPVIYQDTAGSTRQTVNGHYVIDREQRQVAFVVGDYDHSRPLIIDPTLAYSTYLGGSDYDSATAVAVDCAGNAYVAGYTFSTDFPTANPLQSANAGNTDAFIAKLNPSGTALEYSTYLGGSSTDSATAIAVDFAGNAFVAGYTGSINFPTVNPLQSAYAGNTDAFVAKLNPSGTALEYSTYLGGSSSYDYATAIAVDFAGSTYVSGVTASTDFPTVNPLQGANAGNEDAFVAKLKPSGTALTYSTYLGGSDYDVAYAMAVDFAGNAYVAGSTNSTDFPTVNPLQNANAGDSDAFVAKLNRSGTALTYSTYLGGSSYDYATAIAVDVAGNAYVAGGTQSTDFPTANPLQSANAGFTDVFVAKLNHSGTALKYSTYLGGNSDDYASAIAVDFLGNAYVAGATLSIDFPTVKPLQSGLAGYDDAFVAKLSRSGTALKYSTYLGGSGFDYVSAIAVDFAGNAYVAGETSSSDFPTANPLQSANAGVRDAFVAKLIRP